MTPTCFEERRYAETARARTGLSFTGLERFVAALALVVLAPLWLGIGLVLLVLSRRNPLIRHERVGWQGRPLPMLKFRTMWNDGARARPRFAIEKVSGFVPPEKNGRDSRVSSRFAAFCRRHSLDELPQLYHVVRGEMALVGPRPITSEELRTWYGSDADEVLSTRPGLTGLWQIRGRSRLNYARRRRLDLLLVRRRSMSLYLRILLRSIPGVVSGRDAF
ncbi:MAG TPA: sugar transferase [Bryobacteraceae bacterium]|nr:sugar transferase [Bryobacteraceae bacterium]